MRRFITQFFSQAADMGVQGPGRRLAMVSPDLVHQHLARQHISASTHELLQEVELFRSQCKGPVADEHLPALRKKLDFPDAERLTATIVAYTPQYRFHPQHKLARAKGLHHVIIGAYFKADDAVDLLRTRCKHDDWNASRFLAFANQPANLQAAEVRKHDVENDQIG